MSKRVHFVVSRAPKSNKGESRGGRKQNGSKSKKRPWDATVSDLSVHKLTRDELERRHKSHQSKNTDIAKHELYEKAKENLDLDSSGNLRPSPLARGSGQKFAALQRSLQGKELHQVLAESDRALRVVKDMFGDDPMRYTCQPNVTVAPHIVSDKANLERTLMESQRDGPSPTAFASPGGIRDESILELAPSKPALNELPTPTELIYEESGPTEDPTLTPGSPDPSITPQGRGYKSSLDLKRFQALIQREELVDPKSTNPGVSVDPKPYRRPLDDRTQKIETSSNSSEKMQQAVGKGPSKQESGRRMNEMQSSTTSDRTSRHTLHVHVPSAGPTPTQVTAQHDDSVTGLSDISSIPAHTDGGSGRLETDVGGVESDNSLLYSKDAAPLTRPVLSAHPLHVAHKMTPLKRQETTEKIHSELQDLEKLVRGLDRELQDYEQTTSYTSPSTVPPTLTFEPSSHPDSGPARTVRMHTPTSGTLGGITSSLLFSVTKMTHYLRESEAQLKGEMEVRGHLIQTMTEQQNLMDALTTDVVKLQKENVLLRKEIQKAKHNTSEQLLTMQREISDLHKKLSTLVVHPPPQPTPVWSLQPLHHGTVPSVPSLQSLQKPVQTKELPSSLSSPERLPEQPQELNSHPQQYDAISTSLALPSSSSGASTHVQSQGGTLTGSSRGCIYPGSISVHNPSHTNPAVMSTRSPITSHVSVFGPNSSGSQSGLTYIYAQQAPLGYNHGTNTVTPSADSHSAQLTSGVNSVNNSRTKENSVELTPQDSPYIRDPQFSLPSRSQALSTTSSATIPTSFNDTFAPSPPPLSIALQVPGESGTGMTTNKMKVGTSKHSTATSLFSGVSNGSTEPVFDVTSFLNSLGKLGTTERDKSSFFHSTSEISSTPQPSLAFPSQTETVIKQMSTFPTPNSTNITPSTSEKPTLNGKLPNGTAALTTSRGKLSTTESEQSMSRKPLHAPDLSISLLSSLPEQTESSQTASETSLDSRPEHPLVYESKVFQNGTLKQSSSGTKLAHKESVVDSPPGWFALTSHLSHQ